MVYITVTSSWARLRLKSPASRFTAQLFIQAQLKGNIKAPRPWPLYGEFTSDRWIPRTRCQSRAKCFHLMTSSCIVLVLWYMYITCNWNDVIQNHYCACIAMLMCLLWNQCFWILNVAQSTLRGISANAYNFHKLKALDITVTWQNFRTTHWTGGRSPIQVIWHINKSTLVADDSLFNPHIMITCISYKDIFFLCHYKMF